MPFSVSPAAGHRPRAALALGQPSGSARSVLRGVAVDIASCEDEVGTLKRQQHWLRGGAVEYCGLVAFDALGDPLHRPSAIADDRERDRRVSLSGLDIINERCLAAEAPDNDLSLEISRGYVAVRGLGHVVRCRDHAVSLASVALDKGRHHGPGHGSAIVGWLGRQELDIGVMLLHLGPDGGLARLATGVRGSAADVDEAALAAHLLGNYGSQIGKLSFPAGTLKIESTWGVCDS